MKKIILFIALLIAAKSYAQLDTLASYGSKLITITMPVKGVVLYGSYTSMTPTWVERKAPDYFISKIGSGNVPDSIVSVALKADQLLQFVINLSNEKYGIIGTTARSIFNNVPSISGYTGLFTQIANIANGNSASKLTAQYILNRYNDYSTMQNNMYSELYNAGLDWIRN